MASTSNMIIRKLSSEYELTESNKVFIKNLIDSHTSKIGLLCDRKGLEDEVNVFKSMLRKKGK